MSVAISNSPSELPVRCGDTIHRGCVYSLCPSGRGSGSVTSSAAPKRPFSSSSSASRRSSGCELRSALKLAHSRLAPLRPILSGTFPLQSHCLLSFTAHHPSPLALLRASLRSHSPDLIMSPRPTLMKTASFLSRRKRSRLSSQRVCGVLGMQVTRTSHSRRKASRLSGSFDAYIFSGMEQSGSPVPGMTYWRVSLVQGNGSSTRTSGSRARVPLVLAAMTRIPNALRRRALSRPMAP